MIDAKKRGECDQALIEMRELIPRMWFAFFQGSIEAGFSEDQAFQLVRDYVRGFGGRKEN